MNRRSSGGGARARLNTGSAACSDTDTDIDSSIAAWETRKLPAITELKQVRVAPHTIAPRAAPCGLVTDDRESAERALNSALQDVQVLFHGISVLMERATVSTT